jgi:hypothetical protein
VRRKLEFGGGGGGNMVGGCSTGPFIGVGVLVRSKQPLKLISKGIEDRFGKE